MHAFDRRTDRWTDVQTDRILIARPRLHSMLRGKNVQSSSSSMHGKSIEVLHWASTVIDQVGAGE